MIFLKYFFPIENPLRTTDLDFYCMLLFYSILFYSILLYNVFSVFILFVSLAHKHLTISFFFHHPFIPLFICLILSPSFLFPSNYHLLSVPGSFHFLSWISSKPCSPAKKTRMCTRTCVCVCVSLAVEGVTQCCSSFSKSFLSFIQTPYLCPLSSKNPPSRGGSPTGQSRPSSLICTYSDRMIWRNKKNQSS